VKNKPTWNPSPAPKKWGQKPAWIGDKQLKRRKKALKIPKKLGIDLSPELEEEFYYAVSDYDLKLIQYGKMLGRTKLRSLMQNLSVSASAFTESLENIKQSRISHTIELPPRMKSLFEINALIKKVRTWQYAADAAIPPKGKGGNRPDIFLREFIFSLADIFRRATGDEPTAGWYDEYTGELKGLFSNLVLRTLSSLDQPVPSAESLVKKLRKILSDIQHSPL
jgi:hypothetical protein